MPALKPALRFSRLNRGVNRFDAEAGSDQCAEALDVIEDQGDLKRRDAFSAIATGPVFLLPAGLTMVRHNSVNNWNRQFTAAAADVGNTKPIEIGCETPFDGIDWRYVVSAPTSPTQNSVLVGEYWNGSAWTAIPWLLDTTEERQLNGSDIYRQTLCQDGRISWHRSQLSGWATQTYDTIELYAVRLYIKSKTTGAADGTTGVLSGSGNLQLAAPGPRAFLLEPVTGLFPYRSSRGRNVIIVGSDRPRPRGSELGAALGAIKRARGEATEVQQLIGDEGAGVFGEHTWPANWQRAAYGQAWPSGTWTAVTAAGGTEGTDGRLTKHRRDYLWLEDQFRGGVVAREVGVTLATQDTTARRTKIALALTGGPNENVKANEWEHFRLRCVTDGSGVGTPVGEEREILKNDAGGSVYCHEHFSIEPDTQNEFDVLRPHARLTMRTADRNYEVDSVDAAAHQIVTLAGRDFAPEVETGLNGTYVHYEVGAELQQLIRSGRFWTATFELTTGKLLLTNGKSGLLEFDGISTRRLLAMDDESQTRVQSWVGTLPDSAKELGSSVAGSQVRSTPPLGQFVIDFHGRTVVAEGNWIYWSAPAPDNDIWPTLYETQIRGGSGGTEDIGEIRGMSVVNDELLVWTPTAIFASYRATDAGLLIFRPVSQGTGFTSHRAVARVPGVGGGSGLIGPTARGVGIYNGASLTPLPGCERWDRLLEGGVNTARLVDAVGAYSLARDRYYLGVCPAGSDIISRILVFCFQTQSWWVWSCPWGGLGDIARDLGEDGEERMLFGFRDGHIAVLRKADTDDGDTITGYAKSPTLGPWGTQSFHATRMMVMANDTGASESLTLSYWLNRSGVSVASPTQVFDIGSHEFDQGKVFEESGANDGVFAGEALVTRQIPLKSADNTNNEEARCENFQYEVRGASQWVFRMAEVQFDPKAHRST